MARFSIAVTLLALLSAARPADAGIADTPLPVLDPAERTLHLYSVTGVIEQGVLSTYFSCTSTDSAAMKVSVEVFNFLGGGPVSDAVADTVTVVPGGTVLFGTRTPSWTVIDKLVAVGVLSRGSARILATSKKLVCTAFLADGGSAPPTSMSYLTIIKKTQQKASN
jgi:hypothetical protein